MKFELVCPNCGCSEEFEAVFWAELRVVKDWSSLAVRHTDFQVVPHKCQEAPVEEHILQFFEFAHLPEHLQDVAAPFFSMAHRIVETLPRNPERTTALRKLLEAKDCAVRARLAGSLTFGDVNR